MATATPEFVAQRIAPLETTLTTVQGKVSTLESSVKKLEDMISGMVKEMRAEFAKRNSSKTSQEQLGSIDSEVKGLQSLLLARDADTRSIEQRVEEIALKMAEVERLAEEAERRTVNAEGMGGGGWKEGRLKGVLSNPALRNLDPYTGDHPKYAKWRSKLRGILGSEDGDFRKIIK